MATMWFFYEQVVSGKRLEALNFLSILPLIFPNTARIDKSLSIEYNKSEKSQRKNEDAQLFDRSTT